MLAIGIEFVLGRAVMRRPGVGLTWRGRGLAEWPPAPDRLLAALVASADRSEAREAEALEWVGSLGPPEIAAGPTAERPAETVFVPSNAALVKPNAAKGWPLHALAARTFPAATMLRDGHGYDLVYCWSGADPEEVAAHAPALRAILGRLAYLGHSSSHVLAGLVDDPPAPTLVPIDTRAPGVRATGGARRLRVPLVGRLAALDEAFREGRFAGPNEATTEVPYAEPAAVAATIAATPTADLIVLRLDGPKVPLTAAVRLAEAARDRLLVASPVQPAPALICGHDPDGRPTKRPHLAIVPLAFVAGSPHADGLIRGLGVILPAEADEPARLAAALAIGRLDRIDIPGVGEWLVQPGGELATLDPRPYTRPARSWASITPAVLPGHGGTRPGRLRGLAARAVAHEGLPEPDEIDVGPDAWWPVPPAWRYSPRKHQATRPRYHVRIRWANPVAGPVVLGAGRHYGLGLLRALADEGGAA